MCCSHIEELGLLHNHAEGPQPLTQPPMEGSLYKMVPGDPRLLATMLCHRLTLSCCREGLVVVRLAGDADAGEADADPSAGGCRGRVKDGRAGACKAQRWRKVGLSRPSMTTSCCSRLGF